MKLSKDKNLERNRKNKTHKIYPSSVKLSTNDFFFLAKCKYGAYIKPIISYLRKKIQIENIEKCNNIKIYMQQS